MQKFRKENPLIFYGGILIIGIFIYQEISYRPPTRIKADDQLVAENQRVEETSDSKYDFVIENSCGFDRPLKNSKVYSFDSDVEANKALNSIMNLTGLPANFEIRAASIDNACAVIKCDANGNCDRFILYNQEFMERIKDETNSSYSEFAILAHEIAHHLSGHTLTNTGSSYNMELEADKFAGFILFKLGASIEDAKKAYSSLNESGSATHPPKSARIAAISNGFYDAKRNGETVVTVKTVRNVSASEQIENTPTQISNYKRTVRKKDYGEWFIYHRFCSANGQFLVSKGQETAFCSACRQEYYLYWSGGLDYMTGKPSVLDLKETESSRTMRVLENQGW
jgi:hypothetical protein